MTNAGFLLPAAGIPRGAAPGDPRRGHAARDRRDPLARVRLRRTRPRVGSRARPPHARQVDRGRRPPRDLRDARRDRRADRAARGGAGRLGGRSSTRSPPAARCSANALSMAAGRAALLEVLTEEAFEHTAALGERMAAGLRAAIERSALRWSVVHYGSHASYFFVAEPPADGAGSRAADDPGLRALIRVFMANRGVWESGWWLGRPSPSPTRPRTSTSTWPSSRSSSPRRLRSPSRGVDRMPGHQALGDRPGRGVVEDLELARHDVVEAETGPVDVDEVDDLVGDGPERGEDVDVAGGDVEVLDVEVAVVVADRQRSVVDLSAEGEAEVASGAGATVDPPGGPGSRR